MFAQLQGAGGQGRCCRPGDVFKGDSPVVIDGHWGPLLHERCWFKGDKDLTHLPQQKPE